MSLATLHSIYSDNVFDEEQPQQQHDLFEITNPMGLVPDTPIAQPPPAPTTNTHIGPLGNVITGEVQDPATGQKTQVTKPGSTGIVDTAKNWMQRAIFGIDLEDGLFIIIGLLLIAAGLYGFSAVRENLSQPTRTVSDDVYKQTKMMHEAKKMDAARTAAKPGSSKIVEIGEAAA